MTAAVNCSAYGRVCPTQHNKIQIFRPKLIQTVNLAGHALKAADLINHYSGNRISLRELAEDLEKRNIPVSGLASLRDAGAVEIEVTAL